VDVALTHFAYFTADVGNGIIRRHISNNMTKQGQYRTRSTALRSLPNLIPPNAPVDKLREIAAGCRACPLWKRGTQTVFGDGPANATVMFVGEQPGDQEDRAGRPFVGPAGRILDDAFQELGIDRSKVYVTNTVKHFKWVPATKGKRRIHEKPNAAEIAACRPWLDAEIARIKPKLIVCLGATAAQSLLGKSFKVTQYRGKAINSDLAPNVVATVHPSSLYKIPDTDERHKAIRRFVEDIKKAVRLIR
jgi:uracil-DNA glycosylase family protein